MSQKKYSKQYDYSELNTIIEEINVIQLQNLLNHKNLQHILIDVRNQNEYRQNHLTGSLNIPLKQLRKINYSDVNFKNKICFVYCSLDSRSIFASQFLIAQELNVVRVQGGLDAWKNIIGNFD